MVELTVFAVGVVGVVLGYVAGLTVKSRADSSYLAELQRLAEQQQNKSTRQQINLPVAFRGVK